MSLTLACIIFAIFSYTHDEAVAKPWITSRDGVVHKNSVKTVDEFAANNTTITVYACPPAESISPCECYPINTTPPYFHVYCRGEQATTEAITNTLQSIREINNDPEGWLNINIFYVENTLISSVDLSAFYHYSITYLNFWNNTNLSVLDGVPEGIYARSISAKFLWLQTGSLTVEGIGNALTFFDPLPTEGISFEGNNIGSRPWGQEFIPGLNAFTELSAISVAANHISSIGGGQFRTFSRLSELVLSSNDLEEIGDDAFLIDHPLPELEADTFYLYMSYNKIRDNTVNNHGSGILDFTRPLTIFYDDNKFETLSQSSFDELLRNENVNLDMYTNPIVCDSKVGWLKEEALYFEKHLANAYCINDPGETVFTSELIDN